MEGDFDAGGWELAKALRLMHKGNAVIAEWLRSPIMYRARTDAIDSLRELSEVAFRPETATHHYLALARRSQASLHPEEGFRLKTFFYALRASLCARFIVDEHRAPPVAIGSLLTRYLNPVDRTRVAEVMAEKANATEKLVSNDTCLPAMVEQLMARVEQSIPKNPDRVPDDTLNRVFRTIVRES